MDYLWFICALWPNSVIIITVLQLLEHCCCQRRISQFNRVPRGQTVMFAWGNKTKHVMTSCATQEAYLHLLKHPLGESSGLFILCTDGETSGSWLIAAEWRGLMYGYGQLDWLGADLWAWQPFCSPCLCLSLSHPHKHTCARPFRLLLNTHTPCCLILCCCVTFTFSEMFFLFLILFILSYLSVSTREPRDKLVCVLWLMGHFV